MSTPNVGVNNCDIHGSGPVNIVMYDRLKSCDTFAFVVAGSGVVFGKNADRPSDEAHEVVHTPATTRRRSNRAMHTHHNPSGEKDIRNCALQAIMDVGLRDCATSEGVVGGNEVVSCSCPRA